jgi:hypothetical protein
MKSADERLPRRAGQGHARMNCNRTKQRKHN